MIRFLVDTSSDYTVDEVKEKGIGPATYYTWRN